MPSEYKATDPNLNFWANTYSCGVHESQLSGPKKIHNQLEEK